MRDMSMGAGIIYTLYNHPQDASIVAMSFAENGTLFGSPVLTSTGRNGGIGQTGAGQPNVGSLFSSNAVRVGDNYLFTVNAGSNTVSMFTIDPWSPMKPTLVREPVDTLGQFPISVAYSSALNMLCVLNGGAVNGVTCFNVDPMTGLSTTDKVPRSINQALNQTTPPTGPFSTASDIQFNPSSSALVVSVKGSPLTKPVSPGYLYAWPVQGSEVGTTAVVSKLDSVILDFSLSFTDSDFNLLITDPAIGADFLSISSTLQIAVQKPINITYQKAACWSFYDPAKHTVFVSDTAQANITAISAKDGSIVQTINYNGGLGDGHDMVVVGNSLYFVTSEGPIANVDIAGIKVGDMSTQVQAFNPLPASSLGPDTIQGIAAYRSRSYSR